MTETVMPGDAIAGYGELGEESKPERRSRTESDTNLRFDLLLQPDVSASLCNKKQVLLPSGQIYFSVLLGTSHSCSVPYRL